MENVVTNRNFWRGKRVFLTGHTGFKGGLARGYGGGSVRLCTHAAYGAYFFTVCGVPANLKTNTIADIRDAAKLTQAMQAARPDIVLHLAAQPLVHHSHTAPAETYAVNVMGAVNLLEAVRATPGMRAVVIVTTDKCYENREWDWGYCENESLGGYDPYSSSKACVELVTASHRRSFFGPAGAALASARAGNVIGRGDWTNGRLIPDVLRALDAGTVLHIRSPQPHEASYLKLDSSKARARLGWRPRWRLDTALDKILEWHTARHQGTDIYRTTLAQIAEYTQQPTRR